MSDDGLVCWKCGAALPTLKLPWPRRTACSGCGTDLHTCRQCSHYRPHGADQCDEPRAEHPHAKDRANFCDYFHPRAQAYSGAYGKPDAKTQAAKAKLDALFGQASAADTDSDARKKLDELFGAPGKKKP